MEGVSAENNEIYLELTSENLSRALKTAQNARALKIKLTNKHFPCLTVSIELVSGRVAVPRLPQGKEVTISPDFLTCGKPIKVKVVACTPLFSTGVGSSDLRALLHSAHSPAADSQEPEYLLNGFG